MTNETSAYLAEAAAPGLLEEGDRDTLPLAMIALLGRMDLQAGQWLRLLQAARITEDAPEIAGQMEEHAQTLGALRREIAEAEREFAQVIQALQQFERLRARLAAQAEPEA